jgi:hypothetical protein
MDAAATGIMPIERRVKVLKERRKRTVFKVLKWACWG